MRWLHRAVRRPSFIAVTVLLCAGNLQAAQLGDATYKATCALCHQQGAEGLSGQFPRLKGRLAPMLAQASGRRYVIEVVLNGMAGSIEVDHGHLVGVMPPFRSLSDQAIAEVLAYVAGLDGKHKAKAVTAAEVAQVRAAQPLSPTEMRAERDQLAQAGLLP